MRQQYWRPSAFLFLAIICSCAAPQEIEPAEANGPLVVVPQDLFAEVNAAKLHYLDWGGEGPLLLLVHGLTHTAHTWDAIAPSFTDRYRVVAVTRRSHGASDEFSGAVSLDALVDDLASFIGEFTDEPAIVVGQSYAGVEMPRLARRYPEKVRALIFLDAVYDWPGWLESAPGLPGYALPDTLESLEALDAWFEETWPEIWNEAARAHIRSQTYLTSGGKVVWRFPWSGSKWFAFLEAYRGWTSQEYEGISVPVLSIQASQEAYFRTNLERRGSPRTVIDSAASWARNIDAQLKRRGSAQLVEAVPQAVTLEFDSTHHWLHLQRPERVIAAMNEFLSKQVSQ